MLIIALHPKVLAKSTYTMNQIERIKPSGVTLKEVLQDNHRHAVFLIEQNGEDRIYKAANAVDVIHNIKQTVQNYHFMAALTSSNPNSIFRPRQIYQFNADEGWFIGENFNVPPIFPKEPIQDHDKAIELVTKYVAPFLFEVSTYTTANYYDQSLYRSSHPNPVKRPENRLREINSWALTAIQHNLISPEQSDKLLGYVQEHIHLIKTGIELCDLDVWEMFVLGDGKVGIIDLEYLDVEGRRHFDVIWQYCKLWTFQLSQPAARSLLRQYRKLAKEEHLDQVLLTLAIMKFLGVLYDAANQQLVQGRPSNHEAEARQAALQLTPAVLELDINALC